MAHTPIIKTPEIRFNGEYASIFESEYPSSSLSKDSVPTIKKKTLFIKDYLERLNSAQKSSLMPPNCRYIKEMQKGFLVVIEEPPAYRTVKFDMNMERMFNDLKKSGKLSLYGYSDTWLRDTRKPFTFTLAFPYMIFILYITNYFEVHSGQAFARTQQMRGLSDYLLKVPLANISDGGFVCFGNKIRGRFGSLTAAIQHAIMVFWSAKFNTDYMYNPEEYYNNSAPILSNYLEWQYMSQENPMFIYDAEWILSEHNILQRLNYTKSTLHLIDKKATGFRELKDLFYTTQKTGKSAKPYKTAKKEYELFYDIAQGTYLDRTTYVNIGDSFETHDGKTVFIDTFIGFSDGSDIKYMVIDINGQKRFMKWTKNCQEFLKKKIKKQRLVEQITLENGETIKTNDIIYIKINGTKLYRRISYIRKSRSSDDNIYEIKMGSDYFLSNNLDANKFDIENPVLDGLEIKKGKQYVIIRDDCSFSYNLVPGTRAKYSYIDVSSDGRLILKFRSCHPQSSRDFTSLSLSKAKPMQSVYDVDTLKRLNGIFRVGRKIFYMSHSRERVAPECVWVLDNGIVIRDSMFSMSSVFNADLLKTLIEDDRFFLEGSDFDTEFNIGDRVVCANWENPLDVLTVKTIQGFKIDGTRYGKLSFILADKDGNLSEQLYIDGRSGVVQTGKIRKVTNKIDRLAVGTKIRSNVAGIPCFPKKDVNIIVAFIIDTGTEPLVLCSNGCTLWLSTVLENFKRTTMRSKMWPKMQHAPLDLSKIRFQAGDIINGTRDYKNNYGYILYDQTTRSMKALPLEKYHMVPESYTLDEYMERECRLDCIPAPRITHSKIDEIGTTKGSYNIHSFEVTENYVDTAYINQRRT